MSNRVRPVFKNEAGRIEYPPVILTSKESKNQAWYNNTDAGGFESTRGEEYKGHNLRDLPSSFIELEKQAAPPATYSFAYNQFRQALDAYYDGLEQYMEEDKNYGQFVVPYGKRYLGRRLFEIDGAWLVKQRRDEDKFEQFPLFFAAATLQLKAMNLKWAETDEEGESSELPEIDDSEEEPEEQQNTELSDEDAQPQQFIISRSPRKARESYGHDGFVVPDSLASDEDAPMDDSQGEGSSRKRAKTQSPKRSPRKPRLRGYQPDDGFVVSDGHNTSEYRESLSPLPTMSDKAKGKRRAAPASPPATVRKSQIKRYGKSRNRPAQSRASSTETPTVASSSSSTARKRPPSPTVSDDESPDSPVPNPPKRQRLFVGIDPTTYSSPNKSKTVGAQQKVPVTENTRLSEMQLLMRGVIESALAPMKEQLNRIEGKLDALTKEKNKR